MLKLRKYEIQGQGDIWWHEVFRNGNVKIKEPEKGGLKKLWDEEPPCPHPEHKPPGMIVLPPGGYSHTCPCCGKTTTFVIRGIYL